MKKYLSFNYILSTIILLMAILQAPLFYYFLGGLVGLLIAPIYLLIGVILTIFLYLKVVLSKKPIKPFFIVAIICAPIIGSGSLFIDKAIEKADWALRRPARNAIVEMVKEGKFNPNYPYNNVSCHVSDWSVLPISTSGNDISIERGRDKAVTVQFYINRGFLDHYSAFVYTNDSLRIKEIEYLASRAHGKGQTYKLDENWYRVSY